VMVKFMDLNAPDPFWTAGRPAFQRRPRSYLSRRNKDIVVVEPVDSWKSACRKRKRPCERSAFRPLGCCGRTVDNCGQQEETASDRLEKGEQERLFPSFSTGALIPARGCPVPSEPPPPASGIRGPAPCPARPSSRSESPSSGHDPRTSARSAPGRYRGSP